MKVINEYVSERCAIYNGDSAEVMCKLPDNSMDYSIFSPPFEDLYTYSDSDRDLGNCRSTDEFYEQFGFIVEELFRIMKPGRLVSVHCMDLCENEMGRTLSSRDCQMLADWQQRYDDPLIRYAITEAVLYGKYSLDYVDRILYNWAQKGLTAEQYENGER